METVPPIIIIKRKKKGHGHHGGAWKVAYADFVTAMMALFIVLWLTSSSDAVKQAVGGYFQDPTGKSDKMGSGQAGLGAGLSVRQGDMEKLKEKIEAALKTLPQLQQVLKKQVQLNVTGDGLRIELLEAENSVFFVSGNALPTDQAKVLLASVAGEIGHMPNKVLIEGHTDAKPFDKDASYSNWELSADRANAARRYMQSNGMRPDQVMQVRGFADQKLKLEKNPTHASNRRISIIIQYEDAVDEPAGKPKPAAPAAPAHHAGKSVEFRKVG